jgi:HSP20 family protein
MNELTLWDEFETVQSQLSNVEKIMNRVFSNDELVWNNFGSNFPKFDVIELDDKFIIETAIAGYGKEDLKVIVEDKKIKLSGKKQVEYKDGKYHLKELTNKSFAKEIILPAIVDTNNIQVSLKDGILKIELPKKDIQKSIIKEIEIK